MKLSVQCLAVAASLVAGCQPQSGAEPAAEAGDPSAMATPPVAGNLQNPTIREASGLARSQRREDLLWTLNDSGAPATLYAIGTDGADLGSVAVATANNIDWEDIASFENADDAWLLIADIGDNGARRDAVDLYLVREPEPPFTGAVEPEWKLSFVYPNGPRDAEALAVDAGENTAYILSKRTMPAEVYAVALELPTDGEPVVARRLGALTTLPAPLEALSHFKWHWQPTAMDFSEDRRRAAIMTYQAVYLFERGAGESWYDALQSTPAAVPLGLVRGAESMTLGVDAVFVTVEARNAPLYRIDMREFSETKKQ